MHDMPSEEIQHRFDGRADRMVGAFADDFIHVGFRAGQVTDDTILTIQTARAILASRGRLTAPDMARWLGEWAAANEEVWSNGEVFGPSTKKAFTEFIRHSDGWTLDTHRASFDRGTSNGCVMRVAPAGLVHPGRMGAAVELAFNVVAPTHGTQVAISAAAAHAAAVARALQDGADPMSVVEAALEGAKTGEEIGRHARIVPSARVAPRCELAVDLALKSSDPYEAGARIQEILGTNLAAAEAFPAALGLFVAANGDPKESILAAINTGGDTDTIASVVGALAGALRGIDAIPTEWLEKVESVNNLGLEKLASELCELASQLQ
jgi:ADP-ribosylglycohydrolase